MASEESVLGISVEARSNLASTAQADAASLSALRGSFQEVGAASSQFASGSAAIEQTLNQLRASLDQGAISETQFLKAVELAASALTAESEYAAEDRTAFESYAKSLGVATQASLGLAPAITPAMQVVGQLAQTFQLSGTEASAAFKQMAVDAGVSVAQVTKYFAEAQASGLTLAQAMTNLETGASSLSPKLVSVNGVMVDLNANFGNTAKAAASTIPALEGVAAAQAKVAAGAATVSTATAESATKSVSATGAMAVGWADLSESIARAQAGEMSEAEVLAFLNEETLRYAESSGQKNVKLIEQKEAADRSSQGHVNLFETMRGGRMMIAGLLADMALMNIAMGEQVPAATRAAVKEIQVVIDTSVAMAFAFDAFGIATAGAGLALGGLIGIAEVAFTLLSSGSASVGELNKQLDSLAKKDEVTTTLSEIAKVSQEDASTMLAAAKASPEFAAALRDTTEEAVKAQAALSGLPDIMGGLSGAADKIGTNLGILAARLENNLTAIRAWVAGSQAYQDTLRAGGTQIDAFIAQVKATDAVLQGNAENLNRVAEAGAGLQRLRIEADQINSYKTLDETVANLAKRDDAVSVLARITETSQTSASQFLELAKNDQEFANQLDQTLPLIEHLNTQIEITRQMGGDASEAQRELAVVLSQLGLSAQEAASRLALVAQVEAMMTVVPEIGARIAQDAQRTAQLQTNAAREVAQAQQQAADTAARAWRSMNEELANLAFQRTEVETRAAQEAERINREETDAIARAWQQMNDTIDDANRTLNEALARAAQSLADKEYDAGLQLQNKLADIAHREIQQRQEIHNQIVRDRQDLANKIADIERRMWEDIANAAYAAGLDIQKAKTQNEADAARERYLHEAGLIEQRAGDNIRSAEQQFAKEMALEAQKMAQLRADTEYQRAQAERTYEQEVTRAQRAYAEEVAAARQRNADQVADAQRGYAEEVAAAQLRDREQLADLQNRVAAENRALDHQAAQIHQRYQDQVADLANRLQEQVTLIGQRYTEEVKAIDIALIAFIQAENLKMQALAARFQFQMALNAAANQGGQSAGGMPVPAGSPANVGRQMGGEVIKGRSYLVGESGPEVFQPAVSGVIHPSLSTYLDRTEGRSTFNLSPSISIQVTATDGPDVIATVKARSKELTDTILQELERGVERSTIWQ